MIKTKTKTKISLLLFMSVFIFFSCQKDNLNEIITENVLSVQKTSEYLISQEEALENNL